MKNLLGVAGRIHEKLLLVELVGVWTVGSNDHLHHSFPAVTTKQKQKDTQQRQIQIQQLNYIL